MKIVVTSSKSIKPHYGDSGARTASAYVVPLSVFDKVTYDEYVFFVHAFHPPAPSNALLEAGLAKALAEYREWAGRLGVDASGNPAIMLNDAGVRLVEATADATLGGSVMVQNMALGLYPSCNGAEELLLVQLTRFPCGSLVVGYTVHHKVADGPAICSFMLAWGQATRGVAINPVPVHDRTSLFATQDPPQTTFEHRGMEFKHCGENEVSDSVHASDKVLIHRLHFSREWISELKSRVREGAPRRRCTSLECLAAHLWRCITMARGLDEREVTRMRIAVNGRARMRHPRVPQGYTGNAVLWAWPRITVQELVDRPLRHAVELISREVARIDDAYFRSFIDFASSGVVEEEQLVPTADANEISLSTNVDLDCLLGIPFDKLDFGGGPPFFFMPSYSRVPFDGAIYVAQSPVGNGSVDAYVPLSIRTTDAFSKCCYSLPPMVNAPTMDKARL